jgi:hypothetical protein
MEAMSIGSEWDAGWRATPRDASFRDPGQALAHALGRGLRADELALAAVLGRLYDSEINARVTCHGATWTGELGDERNGWDAQRSGLPLAALVDWLCTAACKAYPDSDFARGTVRA